MNVEGIKIMSFMKLDSTKQEIAYAEITAQTNQTKVIRPNNFNLLFLFIYISLEKQKNN